MYQNDIPELKKLAIENLENIFKVYQDTDNRYFYNLIQTIQIPSSLPDSFFNIYMIREGDTWPLISYKTYGDIKLWWIITYMNNIINPITSLKPGNTIKLPKKLLAEEILKQVLSQQ
jgi:LysM repeat protein